MEHPVSVDSIITHGEDPHRKMKFIVIEDPATFFHLLRSKTQSAQRRIVLSALYLGADEEALQLTNDLCGAARDPTRPHLDIQLLLDYSRTMRSSKEYRTTIRPLSEAGVNVHLFRMPQCQDFLSHSLNEILGVYHIKFFIFDDEVILSGANMNGEYFRDRQDRYISLHHKPLVEWMTRLSETLVPFCHRVNNDLSLQTPVKSDMSYLRDELLALSSSRLIEMSGSTETCPVSTQSFAAPIFQFSRIGIISESIVLPRLMQALVQYAKECQQSVRGMTSIVISSPYPSYSRTLLGPLAAYLRPSDAPRSSSSSDSIPTSLSFIMPASSSHGFHRGAGFKSWIPLLHQDTFYRSLRRAGLLTAPTCDALIDRAVHDDPENGYIQSIDRSSSSSTSSPTSSSSSSSSSPLQLCEYGRDGWTYHAKGIWAFPPAVVDELHKPLSEQDAIDSITMLHGNSSEDKSTKDSAASGSVIGRFNSISYIGSSNLGSRSWGRDFELGFVLLSRDPVVHQQLRSESERIQSHCRTLRLPLSTGSKAPGARSALDVLKHKWKRMTVTGLAWCIHTFL